VRLHEGAPGAVTDLLYLAAFAVAASALTPWAWPCRVCGIRVLDGRALCTDSRLAARQALLQQCAVPVHVVAFILAGGGGQRSTTRVSSASLKPRLSG